jgi:hypothetical protein
VKNEAAPVPLLGNAKAVDGKPAPTKTEAPTETKANAPEAAKADGSESHEAGKDGAKAPQGAAPAQGKPAAGKPSLAARIRQMIPGLRKK